MKIGNIDFGDRPLFLAPMEDVTDIGFRMLCKRFGAAMVYTEFVSAEALVRSVQSTVRKLTISDEERPVGTIWIAAAWGNRIVTMRQEGDEGRSRNIERAIKNALKMLAEVLEK
jgi:tRNA-dihydrouridine synthase